MKLSSPTSVQAVSETTPTGMFVSQEVLFPFTWTTKAHSTFVALLSYI